MNDALGITGTAPLPTAIVASGSALPSARLGEEELIEEFHCMIRVHNAMSDSPVIRKDLKVVSSFFRLSSAISRMLNGFETSGGDVLCHQRSEPGRTLHPRCGPKRIACPSLKCQLSLLNSKPTYHSGTRRS